MFPLFGLKRESKIMCIGQIREGLITATAINYYTTRKKMIVVELKSCYARDTRLSNQGTIDFGVAVGSDDCIFCGSRGSFLLNS